MGIGSAFTVWGDTATISINYTEGGAVFSGYRIEIAPVEVL